MGTAPQLLYTGPSTLAPQSHGLLNKHLLSYRYVPDSILHTTRTEVKKAPPLMELTFKFTFGNTTLSFLPSPSLHFTLPFSIFTVLLYPITPDFNI